ncbi:pimeloyl-ACP methyl esterase BioG family protein [uncultured Victivallis sp.]|uniref:DUF452 family protein n=1 Tax=Victivallis sp. TaxID=2049020 RepID=UPI0025F21143|nr:pimeloyl-ACP methyl esterase BioG family protein [uncultured Victivallis sp.]
MKQSFLYRGESSELLLFFNGWSMDERAVAHLASGGLDVLALWDYTEPDTAFFAELSRYRKIHLAAWSLGVFTAAKLLAGHAIEFASATAFNGTLRPVDAAFGIAPEIFRGTAEHWGEERARSRFFQRVAGGRAELEAFPLPCRTPEEQQRELFALEQAAQGALPVNCFRLAVVGTRDRIFPPEAQTAFWQSVQTPILSLDLPHYPFAEFHSFREVTDLGEHR